MNVVAEGKAIAKKCWEMGVRVRTRAWRSKY